MVRKCFELKLADSTQLQPGEFVGLASVFGNVDLGGDRVKSGAFSKTIRAQSGRCPVLWQHLTEEPIGVSLSLKETAEGLEIHGQLNLEVQRGRECYALLKQGAIKGLSFGYDVIQSSPGDKGAFRNLEELRLYEISPVTFAMNPEARVERVKAMMVAGSKYVDFATTDDASALYMARYRMADSLATAMASILRETDRDADERLGLAGESLDQFKSAMLAWASLCIEAMSGEAKAGDDPEAKAGRVLSAKNRSIVEDACATMRKADEALTALLDAADSGKAAHATATDRPAIATPEATNADDALALEQMVSEMKRDAAARMAR